MHLSSFHSTRVTSEEVNDADQTVEIDFNINLDVSTSQVENIIYYIIRDITSLIN